MKSFVDDAALESSLSFCDDKFLLLFIDCRWSIIQRVQGKCWGNCHNGAASHLHPPSSLEHIILFQFSYESNYSNVKTLEKFDVRGIILLVLVTQLSFIGYRIWSCLFYFSNLWRWMLKYFRYSLFVKYIIWLIF